MGRTGPNKSFIPRDPNEGVNGSIPVVRRVWAISSVVRVLGSLLQDRDLVGRARRGGDRCSDPGTKRSLDQDGGPTRMCSTVVGCSKRSSRWRTAGLGVEEGVDSWWVTGVRALGRIEVSPSAGSLWVCRRRERVGTARPADRVTGETVLIWGRSSP
jgi:hypothetical protein